jgi:hypothetical protein
MRAFLAAPVRRSDLDRCFATSDSVGICFEVDRFVCSHWAPLARKRPRSRSLFSLLARVINGSRSGSYHGKSHAETLKELRDEQCCKKSPATPRAERGAGKSDFDADGSAVTYRGRAFTQMVRLRFRELLDGQSKNLVIPQHGQSDHAGRRIVEQFYICRRGRDTHWTHAKGVSLGGRSL